MPSNRHTRRSRRRRSTIPALIAVAVAVTIIGVLGRQSLAASLPFAHGGSDTPFDRDDPEVTNLDPDLLDALRLAAADAATDDIEFVVNSGWRSSADQERLRQEAVVKYGSEAEAARWVAPPNDSAHVSGDAVDLGGPAARQWLAEHGADYGLCRIYDNEPWHYELRPQALRSGCPATYADATQDPRMQR